MGNDIFKSCNRKYGYPDLQKIGFYCYKSNRSGDWHKNDKIPNITILGSYKGYDIYSNNNFNVRVNTPNEVKQYIIKQRGN